MDEVVRSTLAAAGAEIGLNEEELKALAALDHAVNDSGGVSARRECCTGQRAN
jgi:hypothetical protein